MRISDWSSDVCSSDLAAASLKPDLLVSIAPPAGRWDLDSIELPTMPWLVVQGENDEIVDPQAVYDWLEETKAQAELVRMPDTTHFFHRKLIDLRGRIKRPEERRLGKEGLGKCKFRGAP